MKKITKKSKYSRKKKIKNPFINIQSIQEKELLLADLSTQQYLLSEENNKIADEYDAQFKFTNSTEAEKFIDRLPIETLRELINFENGVELNYVSKKIEKQFELVKTSLANEEKYIELTSEINKVKIDILLEKINYVLDNML